MTSRPFTAVVALTIARRIMRKTIFQELTKGQGEISCENNLSEWDLKVAVVSILYSVVQADQKIAHEEVAKLRQILRENYALEDSEVEDLIVSAAELYKTNESYERFCEALLENFSVEQREQVYSYGWRLICADNVIEKSEEAFAEVLRQKLNLDSNRAEIIKNSVIREVLGN